MLTWILGYFWSPPREVSLRLEWGHARALSSRAVAAVSRFRSRGSSDLWLFLQALPRGYPRGLSHMPPRCESNLGVKVEAVQGKQVPLAWTETSGELLVWWHDPGIPLSFPVESTSTGDATGTPGILSRRSRERIPHLELRGGKGLLWMWAGPSCFLSRGDGYIRELLEWQQGCEGPFESSRR